MTATVDRLELLLAAGQNRVTGIDFVEVDITQTVIDVYFLRDPSGVAPSLVNNVARQQIQIYSPSGGETVAAAAVTNVSWPAATRRFMRVNLAAPGDFSLYRLRIDDAR